MPDNTCGFGYPFPFIFSASQLFHLTFLTSLIRGSTGARPPTVHFPQGTDQSLLASLGAQSQADGMSKFYWCCCSSKWMTRLEYGTQGGPHPKATRQKGQVCGTWNWMVLALRRDVLKGVNEAHDLVAIRVAGKIKLVWNIRLSKGEGGSLNSDVSQMVACWDCISNGKGGVPLTNHAQLQMAHLSPIKCLGFHEVIQSATALKGVPRNKTYDTIIGPKRRSIDVDFSLSIVHDLLSAGLRCVHLLFYKCMWTINNPSYSVRMNSVGSKYCLSDGSNSRRTRQHFELNRKKNYFQVQATTNIKHLQHRIIKFLAVPSDLLGEASAHK